MWVALSTFFFSIAVPLVVKVLKALGIGVVIFTISAFAVDQFENFIFNQFSAMDMYIQQFYYLLKIDVGIKMIFAAFAARIAIQQAMGSFNRTTFNPGV